MLVLASQSPRRKYLLESIGYEFDIHAVDIDESINHAENPEDFVTRLACEKALQCLSELNGQSSAIILAADTIVVLGDEILGKPKDREMASLMLQKLSGNTHQVYTGICVLDAKDKNHTRVIHTSVDDTSVCHTKTVCTHVSFRNLSKTEIECYLDTDEPYDKAGSYAIQGLGGVLVDQVNGSYTNIIGLPMSETITLIKSMGGHK